jgi:hypothetical protein
MRLPGNIIVRPRPADFIPPSKSIPWCSIECPRCVPQWEVSQAVKHLQPGRRFLPSADARLRCPNIGCCAILTTTWSGFDGVPFTEGWERRAGS